MKKKHLLFSIATTAIAAASILVACSKDGGANADTNATTGSQNVALYLTDGPGQFDKVVLDIRSVKVIVDTSRNTRDHDHAPWDAIGRGGPRPDSTLIWQTLNFTPGLYDVLQLRNGVDTLLAASNIKAGTIRLLRVDLGTNSTVTKDSVTYPLKTSPSNESVTSIIVPLFGHEFKEFQPRRKRMWLDFDVARSIIQVDSTTFILAPVVRNFAADQTGSVTGVVAPREAKAVISLYSATDTLYAIPMPGGEFKIRGLKDGIYAAHFAASNGFKDTTITNIAISGANNARLGRVMLHK